MSALDTLTEAVKRQRTVIGSAVTLITGLAAQIREAKDEPAKMDALAADLDAQADELGAAVTANTPAETETEPEGTGSPV